MQELISRDEMAHVARWCELVEALAADAEALQAPEAGADDTRYRKEWQALGDRWMALCWTAVTPPFIAASARQARAQVCPQPLQLREGSPEGFQLVADDRYDYLLRLEAQEVVRQRQRDAVAAGMRGKPGPRGRPPMEQEEEPTIEQEQIAQKRAEYAARKAAEREAQAQAQADREARMLEIAAAAPAPTPEPEAPPEPVAAVPQEPAQEVLDEPADDAPTWVPAEELARVLGISVSLVAQLRRTEVFGMDIRQKKGKGYWFDLDAAKRAFDERPMQRRRKTAPAAPAEPLPVVIEPDEAHEGRCELEFASEVPAVEPGAGADDARALLELAGADPAVLQALRVLLLQGSEVP